MQAKISGFIFITEYLREPVFLMQWQGNSARRTVAYGIVKKDSVTLMQPMHRKAIPEGAIIIKQEFFT